MNRKERRAAIKNAPVPGNPAHNSHLAAMQLSALAIEHHQNNRLREAAIAYKRLLAIKPNHPSIINNLGCVLQAQGKLKEASACFARALSLMPQIFRDYINSYQTLISVLPPIGEAARRAAAAWPERLTAEQLLDGGGIAAIADDPLLCAMLEAVPVRSVALEWVLTFLRGSLLGDAMAGRVLAESTLAFACTLAKQCFINEYVFATTPEEDAQVERLEGALAEAIAEGRGVAPLQLAAIAMYRPLYALDHAAKLLERSWPRVVDEVVKQQLREPLQEKELRKSIPALTAIDDETSLRVRQQYEENPYPRWVHVIGNVVPTPLDQYLRQMFPGVEFTPLGKTASVDVLIAGCGTGSQTTTIALTCQGAQMLAVDLSLSSLSYAKRNTPPALARNIEYAQADILKLREIGRTFDVVYSSGVLHHMADPGEAWRILVSLLRPGGLMNLSLYSELGRADVVAARAFIAERGYQPTTADIRRCRQELLLTPLRRIARSNDFFSTSECRDMLFHVHESRMTIPAIKALIERHGLRFIGFEMEPQTSQKFRAEFAGPTTDLDQWHAFETRYPETFESMYQFWVQKP
jgi:2-polyprenyl-3-methyl-5-hydroxy-6-metoxy-1,4-benzoquinol methylase